MLSGNLLFCYFPATLKLEQTGFTIGHCLQKRQIIFQIVKTMIRLFLCEQTDVDLHCLPKLICLKTHGYFMCSYMLNLLFADQPAHVHLYCSLPT